MNFKSDNVWPVSQEILDALISVNIGTSSSYGDDEYSLKLEKRLSEVFEKDVKVYLTNTGTAANSLGLSALVKPYENIYCHKGAHIYTDECGAPEFFTGGAKLVPIDGKNGKINLKLLKESIETSISLRPHGQRPGCISLTQATECGTIYTISEITELCKLAKEYDLKIHMDGARFANSIVSLGCTPAEITWKAGIDVLSFGGTKNGALAAEAIIFFNNEYAKNFDYIHKRAGQLVSKSRFFAAQFIAYLNNNLWLKNAKQANLMAQMLSKVFEELNFEILYPVEANEIFVNLPKNIAEKLLVTIKFYEWGVPGSNLYRFVTSCFTSEKDIADFRHLLNQVNDKI